MLFKVFRHFRPVRCLLTAIAIAAIGLISSSCNENVPAGTLPGQPDNQLHGQSPASPGLASVPPGTVSRSAYVPPADAQFSILVYTEHRPDHVEAVNNLKQYLIGAPSGTNGTRSIARTSATFTSAITARSIPMIRLPCAPGRTWIW